MKIFGQELRVLRNQINSIISNIYCWFFSFIRSKSKALISSGPTAKNVCIVINGPGGLEQLKFVDIPSRNKMTLGYNIPKLPPPFGGDVLIETCNLDQELVLVENKYFSVNYADIAIRWGLYESALRYVGWPIVPGFDFSGVVEWAGTKSGLQAGDFVFGYTLFGSYSSRILVPAKQLRKLPDCLSLDVAAAVPAVAGTALHAIALAGGWPNKPLTRVKAALIHSAAGGVGSMLIQICKIMGFSPIVAVVGSSHKIDICNQYGADYVIDKSESNLWEIASKISPDGYAAIFDANGVETLQSSLNHLSRCGRLIIYGFHTNLPKDSYLSPLNWINIIYGMIKMPKFEAMSMVLNSHTISGFNLSFFADENELTTSYMNQIYDWIIEGKLSVAKVTTFDMKDIGEAHKLIQSGKSVGKIVIKVPE